MKIPKKLKGSGECEKARKKVREIEVKCKPENIFAELAKLIPSAFFISLFDVSENSALNKMILSSELQFVTSKTSNERHDIVLKTDMDFAVKMFPLLFEDNAEVLETVTIYIPSGIMSLAQFIYSLGAGVQRRAVKNDLCILTCTWVTENDSMWICYDDFKGKELFDMIKNT